MSFRKQTSLFQINNRLTAPVHQTVLQTDLLNKIQDEVADVEKYNDFAMSEQQADFLIQRGINSNPMAAKNHVHPMHKAIEQYILVKHVPPMLKRKTTVAFMKHTKFVELKDRAPKVHNLYNAILSEKDEIRYRTAATSPLFRHNSPACFMHDALHFYSPAQVAQLFHKNPQMEHLYATIVVPIETTMKADSLYPSLYQLQYVGNDKVLYIPEGHMSGAYEQPLSASWLLTTGSFSVETPDGLVQLYIHRVDSWWAHHLIMISRNKPSTAPEYVAYDSPELTTIPNIFPAAPFSRRIIPVSLLKKLMPYARSVKSNTELNLEAKVRFLVAQEKYDIPESTQFLLIHFVHQLICTRRKIKPTTTIELESSWLRALQHQLGHWIFGAERKALERFLAISDITPLRFTFRLSHQHFYQQAFKDAAWWNQIEFTQDAEQVFSYHQKTGMQAGSGNQKGAKPSVPSNPIPEEEDEEEDVFFDAEEEMGSKLILKTKPIGVAPGKDCGLQVFVDHGYTHDTVKRAYKMAKEEVRKAYKQRTDGFLNFTAPRTYRGFVELSASELLCIGQVLDNEPSIHFPDHCITGSGNINIYHQEGIHWTLDRIDCSCSHT